MSTIVYDQDYVTDLERLKDTLAAEMEECARKLRSDGEYKLYLGGTVYAHIDFNENPGVTVEA